MTDGGSFDLTVEDISKSFGTPLGPLVQKVMKGKNLRLRWPSGEERDEILLKVLQRIKDDQQVVGADYRTEVWEKGWEENLRSFQEKPSIEALVPKFVRAGLPIRWQGKFCFTEDACFEETYVDIMRAWVFETFKGEGVDEIHEFGAGTGWNLLRGWQLLDGEPVRKFVGSDFVMSSVELMEQVAQEYNAPLESRFFDMKNPDPSYPFFSPNTSGVLTFGSLEQLAGEVMPMFKFLIEKKPALVISIEPASENYDVGKLEDFTAFWFQTRRGYSSGMVETLRTLEAAGLIRVEKIKRLGFGSMMMEGYNLFVWRPI
jgi:hypothetical protein